MQSNRRDFVKSSAALAAAAAVGGSLPAYAQQKQVWKASDVHPLGYPTVAAQEAGREGSPSRRARRPLTDVVHYGRW